MGHVFISYSHKDSKYAHALADSVHAIGIEVWIDERLDYGSQWPHEIQKQLDGCDAFILVMTPRSFASDWVQSELQRAKRKLKPIFPVLLDGDEPWLSVESTQYYDVRGGQFPDAKFYAALRRAVSVEPGSQTYPTLRKSSITARSNTGNRIWIAAIAIVLIAFIGCLGLFIWMIGPSLSQKLFPATDPSGLVSRVPSKDSATSLPSIIPTRNILPTSVPTHTPMATSTEAPAAVLPIYIRVKVLTGSDGTIDTPLITFATRSGDSESFEMNDLNAFRPGQSDEFIFIVSRDFCDFTGYQLTKPASPAGDDPWDLQEVFIYIDNVLVFGDGAADSFSPVTSTSYPPNGYWAETDAYKQRCGG